MTRISWHKSSAPLGPPPRLTSHPHVPLGPVSTRDNRVLKGPLGRSLRLFARTAHSAHSLHSAPLCYARFATLASLACSIHGLAHSLCSLPHGTVEIHESVFTLRSRSKETIAIVVVTRNTPFDNRIWKARSVPTRLTRRQTPTNPTQTRNAGAPTRYIPARHLGIPARHLKMRVGGRPGSP